jgi:hypothetical protein
VCGSARVPRRVQLLRTCGSRCRWASSSDSTITARPACHHRPRRSACNHSTSPSGHSRTRRPGAYRSRPRRRVGDAGTSIQPLARLMSTPLHPAVAQRVTHKAYGQVPGPHPASAGSPDRTGRSRPRYRPRRLKCSAGEITGDGLGRTAITLQRLQVYWPQLSAGGIP